MQALLVNLVVVADAVEAFVDIYVFVAYSAAGVFYPKISVSEGPAAQEFRLGEE